MKDSKFVLPNYTFPDDIVTSDRCFWCGEHGRMTDSHLFPQVLGTRFYTRTTCTPCNSFLGHAVESTLLENVFVTAALAKLKIKDKKAAYGKGKTVELDTGFEMKFQPDGMAAPVTKALGKSGYVGTPEAIAEATISWFAKHYPNWSTKPLEEFYKDLGRHSFDYAGQKFTKAILPGKQTNVAVKLKRQVSPAVIFKIAYEWLHLSGVISVPSIQKIVQALVTVQKSQNKSGKPIHELKFSEEIEHRIIRLDEHAEGEKPNLENLPFSPECYVLNRKTKNGIAFVHVSLFQYLNYFLLLDKIDSQPDSMPQESFDNALFVPTNGYDPTFVELNQAEFAERIANDSSLVDAWHQMIQRPTDN